MPGTQVEIENRSDAPIGVTSVLATGSTEQSRIEPGESRHFSRGITWHVRAEDSELELVHPGRDFAHANLTGELYRFAVEPGICIRVISPNEASAQPDPYPLGGEGCRGEEP